MITMAKRIEELRTERNMSRPALSAALGLPRLAIEKFETGRQTPTQEQQEKIAAYFEVSLFYLRGESNDRTRMEQWMTGDVPEDEPVYRAPVKKALKASPAPSGGGQGGLFDAFLDSPKFRETLKETVLETLRSDKGQEILARVVAKELNRQK